MLNAEDDKIFFQRNLSVMNKVKRINRLQIITVQTSIQTSKLFISVFSKILNTKRDFKI